MVLLYAVNISRQRGFTQRRSLKSSIIQQLSSVYWTAMMWAYTTSIASRQAAKSSRDVSVTASPFKLLTEKKWDYLTGDATQSHGDATEVESGKCSPMASKGYQDEGKPFSASDHFRPKCIYLGIISKVELAFSVCAQAHSPVHCCPKPIKNTPESHSVWGNTMLPGILTRGQMRLK